MNYKTRSVFAEAVAISLVTLASLTLSALSAMAQEATEAQLKSALTFCLFEKFPGVKDSFVDPKQTTVFDSDSKKNFAWDSQQQAWIDTKTLKPVCARNKSDLTFCLFQRFPGVKDSFVDAKQTTVFDSDSKRNFAWDEDKQAWIDTKTLECICPKCPPTGTATTPTPTTPANDVEKRAIDLFLGYQHQRVDGGGEHVGFNSFGTQLNFEAIEEVCVNTSAASAEYCRSVGVIPTIDYSYAQRSDESGGVENKPSIQQILGGVTFRFYPDERPRVIPFVYTLAGVTHHRFSTDNGIVRTEGTATGFAGAFGGGLDIPVGSRVSIRPIQIDYNPQHVNDSWRHNFRVSTGIVFNLGRKNFLP